MYRLKIDFGEQPHWMNTTRHRQATDRRSQLPSTRVLFNPEHEAASAQVPVEMSDLNTTATTAAQIDAFLNHRTI